MTRDLLYFTYGSCSIASLASLEHCERPYEARPLIMSDEGAGGPDFRQISPLRQVPVLVHRRGVLRETSAILQFLHSAHPAAELLPSDPAERRLAHQWMGFLGGAVHPVFRLLFRPVRWVGSDAEAQAALKRHAGAYLQSILDVVETELTGEFVLGRQSALDYYLFVFARWCGALSIPIGPRLSAHSALTRHLAPMRRALEREQSGAPRPAANQASH